MSTNTLTNRGKTTLDTRQMVLISLFSALSYVLMLIHLPYKHLGFLEIEFSDIPAVIAALQYGPLAGVVVELIKNLIKAITASTTSGIGELANFLISIAYIIPVGLLYKIRKAKNAKKESSAAAIGNWKNSIYLIAAFVIGTICMVAAGASLNYFFMIPLYAKLFGGMEIIVGAAAGTIPAIKDLGSLVLLGITPFNVMKGIAMSIIGYYTFRLLKGKIL